MDPNPDKRTILTLDAGGTNFIFSAMCANEEIVQAIHLPSSAHDLQKCISTMIDGFEQVQYQLETPASAISFGLPGPTDPLTGIVGTLTNLPAFHGGVPLGPILEHKFNLPVFINNDANLFAYGEAISGFLPDINNALEEAGVNKRYSNLVGITLGTGFGAGIVRNEELFLGDNSMAGEIWLLRNRINPKTNAEEGISIRAVQRIYATLVKIELELAPTPSDIFEIASDRSEGNREAAREAFNQLGITLGDAIGNILNVIDGAVVIGGGISGAMPLFMPSLIKEISSEYDSCSGDKYPRLSQKVFNYSNKDGRRNFLSWPQQKIEAPEINKSFLYSPEARIPIGVSTLGTSTAIAQGAYAFALKNLE